MIDVKIRTASEALADDVDEVLEDLLFRLTVLPPEGTELWSSTFDANDAEQILEASARLEMRIAFHVEEEISGLGLWKQAEPAMLLLGRQQLGTNGCP